jgi:replication fork protection complex subunit Tof1/Swi1
LSQKTEYNRFNTLCLEIFYLLFRGVEKAELLIRKNADVTKLLNAEKNVKRINGRKGVTRHSRFGTTVMIQNGKDRIVMHKQSSVAQAISNPGKVIDQDKKIRANRNVPTTNELSRPVDLRPEALKVLQAVAMSFLESSFNREL